MQHASFDSLHKKTLRLIRPHFRTASACIHLDIVSWGFLWNFRLTWARHSSSRWIQSTDQKNILFNDSTARKFVSFLDPIQSIYLRCRMKYVVYSICWARKRQLRSWLIFRIRRKWICHRFAISVNQPLPASYLSITSLKSRGCSSSSDKSRSLSANRNVQGQRNSFCLLHSSHFSVWITSNDVAQIVACVFPLIVLNPFHFCGIPFLRWTALV